MLRKRKAPARARTNINLQNSYNLLAKSGGGCLDLAAKVYDLSRPLIINNNNVKIIGRGKDQTILYAPRTNAIVALNGAHVNMEGVTIVTRSMEKNLGTGIWVNPSSTVDFTLKNCSFRTTLGAITYRNHPDNTSLGHIQITYCDFEQSCINPVLDDYPTNSHKVLFWGRKTADKKFMVNFNNFAKHRKQRKGVIELCVWGDCVKGKGKGPMTLINGHIIGNTFRGATRECLAVSDHQKFIVKDNIINDSNRVGLYVIRGYRSIISNNIVNNSRYRGHRVAHLEECIWMGNACYNTGKEDNANIGVGGMHISYSHNNVVLGNTILAEKGYAIAVNNGSVRNIVQQNLTLGSNQEIFVDQKDRNIVDDVQV